ncbi:MULTISPECIES: type II toxin-antitoxin system VapC family toxin [Haloarcula]|uniref:type II toxin-antitoxin system VapC family toxin n=1 Tax=Haloarcula TaxID=2237 RepID=UPI0023E82CE0|nr:PIN domain-containing protein [Halomicroarcula sp. SHR3]
MSVFIDTGVFYAHHDTDANRHTVGMDALNTVLKSSEYGYVLTSDYVYDEVVTLTHRQTGDIAAGIEVGRRIRGEGYPDAIDMLHSSRQQFTDAVTAHQKYAEHGLSFTDAMTVTLVDHHDIDAVLSFDDDFDGVVDRLDPATVAGP